MRLEMIEPGCQQWPLVENGAVELGGLAFLLGLQLDIMQLIRSTQA